MDGWTDGWMDGWMDGWVERDEGRGCPYGVEVLGEGAAELVAACADKVDARLVRVAVLIQNLTYKGRGGEGEGCWCEKWTRRGKRGGVGKMMDDVCDGHASPGWTRTHLGHVLDEDCLWNSTWEQILQRRGKPVGDCVGV
jgi:hypothetical protein